MGIDANYECTSISGLFRVNIWGGGTEASQDVEQVETKLLEEVSSFQVVFFNLGQNKSKHS